MKAFSIIVIIASGIFLIISLFASTQQGISLAEYTPFIIIFALLSLAYSIVGLTKSKKPKI